MFKLVVESSKDVKRITIDFGDESSTVTEVNPVAVVPVANTVDVTKNKDIGDLLSERSGKTNIKSKKETKPEVLPAVDIENRPPKIDEDFNSQF